MYMLLCMVEGPKFVLALTMPKNDFGEVIEFNTYLEAILHLSMLFGMAEALTIPENAFEAVLDFNAYL